MSKFELMLALNKQVLADFFSGKFNRARLVYSSKEVAKVVGFQGEKIITERNGMRYEYDTNTGASIREVENYDERLRYSWLRLILRFDTEEQMKASPYYGQKKRRNRKRKEWNEGISGHIVKYRNKCSVYRTSIKRDGHLYDVVSVEFLDETTGVHVVAHRTETLML